MPETPPRITPDMLDPETPTRLRSARPPEPVTDPTLGVPVAAGRLDSRLDAGHRALAGQPCMRDAPRMQR
jgi:hypothetical protein